MYDLPKERVRYVAPTSGIPPEQEHAIGTSGTLARYHELLNRPFSIPLASRGYIIGFEKGPGQAIGYPTRTYFDDDRLFSADQITLHGRPQDQIQQKRDFKNLFDRIGGKKTFLSHILRYGPASEGVLVTSDPIFSTYSGTGYETHTLDPSGPDRHSAYQNGWAALEELEKQLVNDIATAAAEGRAFTHIQVMSMGWNNDQFEALERYNDLIAQTARHSGSAPYNPLIIGITWPSVWHWGGPWRNHVAHILSYLTKCRDADQIGLTFMNDLVNRILPRIENDFGLRTVLLGHSMGARILSRAYFSSPYLKNAVQRSGPGPLLIGLQGAFDAYRFASTKRMRRRSRWIKTGEGAPYSDYMRPNGNIVLTWAKDDDANPIAYRVTGSHHVGGKHGDKAIRSDLLRDISLSIPWDRLETLLDACERCQKSKEIMHIDASDIIKSHGDIRDPSVGQLVATVLQGFGI